MRIPAALALALATFLTLGTVVPATADDAPPLPRDAVQAYADAFATPGIAAALITDDGVETVVRGRDGAGAPVTARTPFRVASMSKSMTATAIMLLVQDRRVDLDAPVVDLLPEFVMADPRHREVTTRQLLSHTSGLSLRTNDEYAFPIPRTSADVVAELRDRVLAADPGTAFEYHNTNYSIAARIVEIVSGQSLDEFLRTRLFGPLGMTGTSAVEGCDDPVTGLTEGYSVVLGLAWAMPEMPGRCGGNGGVVSTLDDMARWILFNRGDIGTDLLAPSLRAQLYQAQPAAGPYALGWESRDAGDGYPEPLIVHGGTLATFTGSMAFSPTTDTAAVVLTNAVGSPGDLVRNLIASADGEAAIAYQNPLNAVNGVLLGVALGLSALLLAVCLRAPRWASRRLAAEKPHTVLRLLPLAFVAAFGLFVPLLPGLLGGAVFWQYWIVNIWLFPLLDAVGLVMLLGGVAALVSRIVSLRLSRYRDSPAPGRS